MNPIKVGDRVVVMKHGERYLRSYIVSNIDESSEAPFCLVEKVGSSEAIWCRAQDVEPYDSVPDTHQTWHVSGIVEQARIAGSVEPVRFIRMGPQTTGKRKHVAPKIGDVVLVGDDQADPRLVVELVPGGSFVVRRIGGKETELVHAEDVRVLSVDTSERLRREAETRLHEKKRKLMVLAADLLNADELESLLSSKRSKNDEDIYLPLPTTTPSKEAATALSALNNGTTRTPIRPPGTSKVAATYAKPK